MGGELYWGGKGLEAWFPAGESPEENGDMFRDNNVEWFSMSSNISQIKVRGVFLFYSRHSHQDSVTSLAGKSH